MMVVDYPFYEAAMEAMSHTNAGRTVHQKFTCVHCGSRQTMAEPNRFFTMGKCEECAGLTDLEQAGCNYLVIAGLDPDKNNARG